MLGANMKIEIQQKDLLNKISIALKAVSRKTNIQIHELIYFEAKNDTLTEFATSLDETKLALTGILFELKDGYLNFVALDGYRVALKKLKLSYPSSMDKARLIIPRKSISEWTRIIDDEKITKIYKDDKDII